MSSGDGSSKFKSFLSVGNESEERRSWLASLYTLDVVTGTSEVERGSSRRSGAEQATKERAQGSGDDDQSGTAQAPQVAERDEITARQRATMSAESTTMKSARDLVVGGVTASAMTPASSKGAKATGGGDGGAKTMAVEAAMKRATIDGGVTASAMTPVSSKGAKATGDVDGGAMASTGGGEGNATDEDESSVAPPKDLFGLSSDKEAESAASDDDATGGVGGAAASTVVSAMSGGGSGTKPDAKSTDKDGATQVDSDDEKQLDAAVDKRDALKNTDKAHTTTSKGKSGGKRKRRRRGGGK